MTDRTDPDTFPTPPRAERRRDDPLRRLSRRFDAECLEATGPLEIAAHLEHSGYNNHRVRLEFGLDSTFTLAERLFALTPRRQRMRPVRSRRRASPSGRLTVAAALLLTLPLAADAASPPWAFVVAALAWLVVGDRVVERADAEGSARAQRRVFTLLLGLGLPALLVAALSAGFGAAPLLMALLWWTVIGNLWLTRLTGEERTAYAMLPLLVVGAALLPNVPAPLALAFGLVTSLIGFSAHALVPSARTWRWLGNHAGAAALALTSGVGQGLLVAGVLAAALTVSPAAAAAAALLVAALVGVGGSLFGWARARLAAGLWLQGRESDARGRVWAVADRLTKGVLLGLAPLLPALLLVPTPPALAPLADAALLGTTLAMGGALAALSARALPAVLFPAAGLALAAGAPAAPLLLALVVLFYLALLVLLADPRRYSTAVL